MIKFPPILNRPPYQQSSIISKGWGFEAWLVNFPKYCAKVLHFDAGKRCSYHYHLKKEESWFVQSGRFDLKIGKPDGTFDLVDAVAGESFHIEPGVPHQISCVEAGDIWEVSTEHFEDDSWRVERGD